MSLNSKSKRSSIPILLLLLPAHIPAEHLRGPLKPHTFGDTPVPDPQPGHLPIAKSTCTLINPLSPPPKSPPSLRKPSASRPSPSRSSQDPPPRTLPPHDSPAPPATLQSPTPTRSQHPTPNPYAPPCYSRPVSPRDPRPVLTSRDGPAPVPQLRRRRCPPQPHVTAPALTPPHSQRPAANRSSPEVSTALPRQRPKLAPPPLCRTAPPGGLRTHVSFSRERRGASWEM